jgi:hypothetical protein
VVGIDKQLVGRRRRWCHIGNPSRGRFPGVVELVARSQRKRLWQRSLSVEVVGEKKIHLLGVASPGFFGAAVHGGDGSFDATTPKFFGKVAGC